MVLPYEADKVQIWVDECEHHLRPLPTQLARQTCSGGMCSLRDICEGDEEEVMLIVARNPEISVGANHPEYQGVLNLNQARELFGGMNASLIR